MHWERTGFLVDGSLQPFCLEYVYKFSWANFPRDSPRRVGTISCMETLIALVITSFEVPE
jgi:hypothetical protein